MYRYGTREPARGGRGGRASLPPGDRALSALAMLDVCDAAVPGGVRAFGARLHAVEAVGERHHDLAALRSLRLRLQLQGGFGEDPADRGVVEERLHQSGDGGVLVEGG